MAKRVSKKETLLEGELTGLMSARVIVRNMPTCSTTTEIYNKLNDEIDNRSRMIHRLREERTQ